ncbi:S-adenosyl-L-methionine-dependent methyltransferase [Sesbania bispinosa]|nr:S-adenosyl-L-methionine-dependent methyltransferase [Sesbania bispinosa]
MSAGWSAENAKRAYLQALKMAKRGKEPDVAEFISALAAGKNAQLMVVASAGVADSTTLALAAAAHQTGGRVVCISCGENELKASKKALGVHGDSVEFVVGDVKSLMLGGDYKGADFVLVDCDITNAREVFLAAFKGANKDGALVVGYNVRHRASRWRQLKASFLPIGEGLLVTKIDPIGKGNVQRRRSRWIVQVDNCTGEEHIFRVTSSYRKVQLQV